jgi:hypothetical protein
MISIWPVGPTYQDVIQLTRLTTNEAGRAEKKPLMAKWRPARFRWVKAPTSQELTQLAHTIAHRVGCFLER